MRTPTQSADTQERVGELLEHDELPEAVHHAIAPHQGAVDWNNGMLGAFAQALRKPGDDLDRVRELLKIQKEIQQENARLEFNAAMARVQARIVPVVKNKENVQTKSWYADLNAICDMVTPIYSSEGFSVSYSSSSVSDGGEPLAPGFTRTIQTLAHTAGFERRNYLDLPIDNAGKDGNKNKTDIHGIKSSHTYARNILITMAFNIAQKGADDDGNAAGGGFGVEVISDEQYSRLVDMLDDANLSPKWLAQKMRLRPGEELDRLPASRLNLAIAEIQKQVNKNKGGK